MIPSLNASKMTQKWRRVWNMNLYTDENRGPLLEMRYNAFGTVTDFAALAERVCATPGVTISANALRDGDYKRRPSMPLSGFTGSSRQTLLAGSSKGSH